ncbi:hypothetical protein LguiA_034310 [Lonicera macranthoides]
MYGDLFRAVPTDRGPHPWKLKDLLLFRSTSEGTERNKKYAVLMKSENNDVKNFSFRPTESSGCGSRRRVTAHELHYTANRVGSEEMRRKTFLPYKREERQSPVRNESLTLEMEIEPRD